MDGERTERARDDVDQLHRRDRTRLWFRARPMIDDCAGGDNLVGIALTPATERRRAAFATVHALRNEQFHLVYGDK